jgi:hypothetical protein
VRNPGRTEFWRSGGRIDVLNCVFDISSLPAASYGTISGNLFNRDYTSQISYGVSCNLFVSTLSQSPTASKSPSADFSISFGFEDSDVEKTFLKGFNKTHILVETGGSFDSMNPFEKSSFFGSSSEILESGHFAESVNETFIVWGSQDHSESIEFASTNDFKNLETDKHFVFQATLVLAETDVLSGTEIVFESHIFSETHTVSGTAILFETSLFSETPVMIETLVMVDTLVFEADILSGRMSETSNFSATDHMSETIRLVETDEFFDSAVSPAIKVTKSDIIRQRWIGYLAGIVLLILFGCAAMSWVTEREEFFILRSDED